MFTINGKQGPDSAKAIRFIWSRRLGENASVLEICTGSPREVRFFLITAVNGYIDSFIFLDIGVSSG